MIVTKLSKFSSYEKYNSKPVEKSPRRLRNFARTRLFAEKEKRRQPDAEKALLPAMMCHEGMPKSIL